MVTLRSIMLDVLIKEIPWLRAAIYPQEIDRYIYFQYLIYGPELSSLSNKHTQYI